jgi:hypothetical protein
VNWLGSVQCYVNEICWLLRPHPTGIRSFAPQFNVGEELAKKTSRGVQHPP